MEKLAIFGGTPAIENAPEKHLFGWPILTEEDEAAALQVIRDNSFPAPISPKNSRTSSPPGRAENTPSLTATALCR